MATFQLFTIDDLQRARFQANRLIALKTSSQVELEKNLTPISKEEEMDIEWLIEANFTLNNYTIDASNNELTQKECNLIIERITSLSNQIT